MTHLVCFIDDSDFEHDLVKNEIAAAIKDMTFVQAYTFDQAKLELGRMRPSLFLLDLWGQDPAVTNPRMPPMTDIEEKVAGFPTLNQVYEGLETFSGDVNNEYLKRFFAIVDCWRSLFEAVCVQIGQNSKYGLSNLRQARQDYPGVPAVFYTRKSLIRDAVAMFKAGADGLFIKPTGRDNADTRHLTRQYAPVLAAELRQIIRSKNY
jgi:DNA-binding NarL/FixJ family response regulator